LLGPIRVSGIVAMWAVVVVLAATRHFAWMIGFGAGTLLYSVFLGIRWRHLEQSTRSR
jgi:hypothetical protein